MKPKLSFSPYRFFIVLEMNILMTAALLVTVYHDIRNFKYFLPVLETLQSPAQSSLVSRFKNLFNRKVPVTSSAVVSTPTQDNTKDTPKRRSSARLQRTPKRRSHIRYDVTPITGSGSVRRRRSARRRSVLQRPLHFADDSTPMRTRDVTCVDDEQNNETPRFKMVLRETGNLQSS